MTCSAGDTGEKRNLASGPHKDHKGNVSRLPGVFLPGNASTMQVFFAQRRGPFLSKSFPHVAFLIGTRLFYESGKDVMSDDLQVSGEEDDSGGQQRSKRKRRPAGFHAQLQEGDSPSEAPLVKARKPRTGLPEANPAAAEAFSANKKPNTKRRKGFWPHESKGPRTKTASDVVVPKKIDLSAGTRPGSAEVKIMNLTASQADKRNGTGDPSLPRWGGTCTVTKRELQSIRHKRPADNTDRMILCLRDPYIGDVWVFNHLVNVNHTYYFNSTTFRPLSPRPSLIDGEPPPGRHRDVAAMQAWIDHMTVWTGGPPILILHFHREEEDKELDEHRPTAPAGVPIVRGVGVGEVAPAGAELTHAFMRKRLKRHVLARNKEDPIKDVDEGDLTDRIYAFERCFLDTGSNNAFGELGCAIALDALIAGGALAAVRHPSTRHHYDVLFAH
jgi:hypothetical protein